MLYFVNKLPYTIYHIFAACIIQWINAVFHRSTFFKTLIRSTINKHLHCSATSCSNMTWEKHSTILHILISFCFLDSLTLFLIVIQLLQVLRIDPWQGTFHTKIIFVTKYAIEKKNEKVVEAHNREFCEMTGNFMFPHVIKRHKNLWFLLAFFLTVHFFTSVSLTAIFSESFLPNNQYIMLIWTGKDINDSVWSFLNYVQRDFDNITTQSRFITIKICIFSLYQINEIHC